MTLTLPRSLLGAAAALLSSTALAQATPPAAMPTPAEASTCPSAKAVKAPQLYGLWSVHFSNPPKGLPADATMLIEQHKEFSESLAGMVSRDLGTAAGSPAIAGHAAKALLAGDLDDGILVLDESSDNTSITGTWNGEVVEGSCGTQVRGVWKDTSRSAPTDAPDVPFLLRKRPG